MPPAARERYAAQVTRLLRPGGLFLLYAAAPHHGQHGLWGITTQQVETLFAAGFDVARLEEGIDRRRRQSAWFWLRRRDE